MGDSSCTNEFRDLNNALDYANLKRDEQKVALEKVEEAMQKYQQTSKILERAINEQNTKWASYKSCESRLKNQ